MIIGIGTDIIEIDRIEKAINNNKNFLKKTFTENERKMFEERKMRTEVIAGNFAGKEAVSKSLGTGIRGFSFKDIEILRNDLGKPIVYLSKDIEAIINKEYRLSISISHNKSSAIAFVVLEEL